MHRSKHECVGAGAVRGGRGGERGAVVDRVKMGVVRDCPHGYEAVGQWDGEEQNTGEIKVRDFGHGSGSGSRASGIGG